MVLIFKIDGLKTPKKSRVLGFWLLYPPKKMVASEKKIRVCFLKKTLRVQQKT